MPVDINDAAHDLAEQLGRPPWLSSIGVGGLTDPPSIVIYLRREPIHRPKFFDDGWRGHPVIVRMTGDFAPLGQVD